MIAPMLRTLFSDVTPRAALVGLATLALLLAVPAISGAYVMSLVILALYLAVLGQAWNIMFGFAGLLSLGHALYIGLGAYLTGALYTHYQLSPWLGLVVAMAACGALGAFIGFLGFRFGIRGVYFALLTIAFAEFVRILFDHWGWVGGSSGLFLPVQNRTTDDLWTMRGTLGLFYYVILGGMLVCLAVARLLLKSKLGYYWQAIREDEEAAQALGINLLRTKMAAVAVSAMMTSFGGMFYAFYYNTLYPEAMFSIVRSIELLLGVIIGGMGTLIGPILGAIILTGVGEVLSAVAEALQINGLKQFSYGLVLLVIILLRPKGLWPWLYDGLRLGRRPAAEATPEAVEAKPVPGEKAGHAQG